MLPLTDSTFRNRVRNPDFKTFRGLILGMRIQVGKATFETTGVYKNGDVFFRDVDGSKKTNRLNYIEAVRALQEYANPIKSELKVGMLIQGDDRYRFSSLGFPQILKIDDLLVTLSHLGYERNKVIPVSDLTTTQVTVVRRVRD